jgi:hypothetical protein
MKVIGHQAKGVNLPAGLFAGLAQRFQEPAPVLVILKDGLAPVAPIHDVVNRPRILNSQFAPHDRDYARKGKIVSIILTDPFIAPPRSKNQEQLQGDRRRGGVQPSQPGIRVLKGVTGRLGAAALLGGAVD